MRGGWTKHAYRLSHDGQACVVHLPDGIEVRVGERSTTFKMVLPYSPREFIWHPDSRRVAFWAPPPDGEPKPGGKEVALLDVRRMSAPRPYTILYTPPASFTPFGMEWGPKGEALYVVERGFEEGLTWSQIKRIDLSSGEVERIVREPGLIDFFMPPVSRFENGSGASPRPFLLVYGTPRGLLLTHPRSNAIPWPISSLPAVGLQNVEWSPSGNLLALFFKHPVSGPNGQEFRGLWLVSIDARGRPQGSPEQLYRGTDVHTLWFSPSGTYVTWSTPDGIWFRRPQDAPDATVKVESLNEDGILRQLRGVTWHPSEDALAYCADNKVFTYRLATKETRELASFGSSVTHFTAEPRWVGGRVLVSVFGDLGHERSKNTNRGVFGVAPGSKR